MFLKVAPSDDAAEHGRLLMEVDAFDFVRGFSFNLPPGKAGTPRLTTPRSACEQHPGAVAGKPVEDLINRCIVGLAARGKSPPDLFHG